jgi:hypothetical protein
MIRGAMRRTPQTDKDRMSLPAGRTCGDCVYLHRCAALFGHQASDEVCDFAPSRFYLAPHRVDSTA